MEHQESFDQRYVGRFITLSDKSHHGNNVYMHREGYRKNASITVV